MFEAQTLTMSLLELLDRSFQLHFDIHLSLGQPSLQWKQSLVRDHHLALHKPSSAFGMMLK